MATNENVIATYDPKKVTVAMRGTVITGHGDGVIKITNNEDRVTTQPGVKGDITFSENANESALANIPLMTTSSSIALCRQLCANRAFFTLMVSDANDADTVYINAENCRITKMPDYDRQKEATTIQIPVFIPHLEYR